MARSGAPSRTSWRFTLVVIEKLKEAGFGRQREFLKNLVDHFVVSQ